MRRDSQLKTRCRHGSSAQSEINRPHNGSRRRALLNIENENCMRSTIESAMWIAPTTIYPSATQNTTRRWWNQGWWPQINHLSPFNSTIMGWRAFHCPPKKKHQRKAERRKSVDTQCTGGNNNGLRSDALRERKKMCVMRYQKLHNSSHAEVWGSRNGGRSSIAVNNGAAWTFFRTRSEWTSCNRPRETAVAHARTSAYNTHASISVNALIFISNYFTI